MGGRMMYFYADDLTNMLMEDILRDTVMELQEIESKERTNQSIHESK